MELWCGFDLTEKYSWFPPEKILYIFINYIFFNNPYFSVFLSDFFIMNHSEMLYL